MRIQFQNLDSSEMAREIVEDRITEVIEKFPSLQDHDISVTLSMENSPTDPGPQNFTVKLRIHGSQFSNLILSKKGSSLYAALASVTDSILERIQRSSRRKSKAHLRFMTRQSLRRPAS